VNRVETQAKSKPRRRNNGHRLTRSLHSWTSMVSLLVVLFFALSGLLLNNPSWTFGQQAQTSKASGELPTGSVSNGTADYLVISEYLRANQGATGQITDYGSEAGTGRISYGAPGYTATANFNLATGEFTMQTTRYGVVALITDLHKGTNVSTVWKLAIDAAAILLSAVAVTGLVLQLFLAKKRRTALILLTVGVVGGLVLMFLA
jgi:uncharacterized protein